MPKFRKIPVVIEAVEWTGENRDEINEFIGLKENPDDAIHAYQNDGLLIKTLEGTHLAHPGDMIIKGVKGEFYPCKPDIFAMTYEPAE
jgi:hypothetical protein